MKTLRFYYLFFLLFFSIVCDGRENMLISNETSDSIDSYSTKLIELCEDYVRQAGQFTYGGNHAAFRRDFKSKDGKYEINCSTFSLLVSSGINCQNSRYKGGTNKGEFKSKYTDDLIDWFSDGGTDDRNIKYSRDIAKKLFEDGYGKIPDESFSDLETGDILFFNLDPANDRPNIDFMGVDHSAIFGYKFGDKFVIYEVGDDKGPKRVLKTQESLKKVVLVGKLPNKRLDIIKQNELAKNNEEHSLNIVGNGKENYKIAEVNLDTHLKKGKCYTILIDAAIGEGNWLNATYNGTSSYVFNMTNVRDYRPSDGVYRIHFTAPEDIHTLQINVRSNVVTRILADFKFCNLYEGIITDN